MNIAIVILNWNGKQLLEQFLPSVVSFSAGTKIYVVDNASTDDSILFLKEKYPEITIIQNTTNGGYAKGYNDALQHVVADVYCLLNSDVEVTKNWLKPIISTFERDETIAAIQPKILDFKDKHKFEYAGAGGGFIDQLGYPFCRGRIFDTIETDTGQYNDIVPVFWASGACLFVKSKTFFEVGGFDETYFAHQEEIDLCWRIQNLGKQIYYVGIATVYHVGGATLATQNPKKTFLNFRNSLFNVLKNSPKNKGFYLIFVRLCLDGLAGIQYVLKLKPLHTLAIIKAHFNFYAHLFKMLKKRSKSPKKQDYYQTKSIVWNYFVKGRKRF